MKFSLPLFALVIILGCFTACNKSSGSTTPTAQDTLQDWQKITTAETAGFSDVWFLNPARGIAAGITAVYNSSDSGKTWSKITAIPEGSVNLYLFNAQRGASLGQQAIYITDDYTNWRAKTSPVTFTGLAPDIRFTSIATCYASANNGLFKTTDTANTWNKVYSNPVNGMYFFDDNTGVVYDYSATPPSDVYKTWDGGAHWQPLGYIPGHVVSYNTLQFTDSLHGWLSRGDSLFNTIDGGKTWYGQKSRDGLMYDVQFINNNVGYYAAYGEIYKTTDGGQNWSRTCKLANEGIIEIFFLDEKTGWACGSSGSILRLKQ